MDPICVNVPLGDRSYAIRIGMDFHALSELEGRGLRALLVSDTHVGPLYGEACRHALEKAGFEVVAATVAAGEQSKTLDEAGRLYTAAAAAGLDRAACVVALGGGVIGDLAGFVAATYLRGIALIQVPTSLLAMVDSSVGGKTAVNLAAGKNLVGCFHQPREVIVNMAALRTLPEREQRCGLAEILKYGLILDAGFHDRIAAAAAAAAGNDIAIPPEWVARCCELKAGLVARDERDQGLRALLNFGHTFGHAIEAWSGYGEWLHGEAVAVGMVFAAHLSVRLGTLTARDAAGIEECLANMGLPVRISARESDWRAIRQRMRNDKKNAGDAPRFVLLEGIGRAVAGRPVAEKELEEVWHVIRK